MKIIYLLKGLWTFIKELGGISLLFAVITFWIIQHNGYVAIGNAIRADTYTNLSLTEAIISDEKKEWGYLQTFLDENYTKNLNYIIQYYDKNCFQKIRSAARNIESINTLIIQRQIGNRILDQDLLYQIAKILKPDLEYITNCQLRPWWNPIWYKLY